MKYFFIFVFFCVACVLFLLRVYARTSLRELLPLSFDKNERIARVQTASGIENMPQSQQAGKETYINGTHKFTFTYTSVPGLQSIRCSKGEVTSRAGQRGDDSIAFVPSNPEIESSLCTSDPEGAYHPVVVEVIPGNSATAQEFEHWSFTEWTTSVDTTEVDGITGVRAKVSSFVVDPEGSGFGYPGIEQIRVYKDGNTYLFTLGNSDEPTYRTLYNEIVDSFTFEE